MNVNRIRLKKQKGKYKIPVMAILSVITLLSISTSRSSTDARIDSLEATITEVSGKEKVEVLNALSRAYRNLSPKKTLDYGNQALKLSEKLDYNTGKAQSLDNIGGGYYYLSSYDKALEYYLKSLKISEKIGSKEDIARTLINIGSVYRILSNYDKSLEYYRKSLEISEKIGFKENTVRTLSNIGEVYQILGNYNNALEYFQKSLQISKKIGIKESVALILNNIGRTYYYLSNYNIALEYYLKSFKIYEEIGNKEGIARSLNNIGELYLKQENYNKALSHLRRSLKLSKEIKSSELIRNTYSCFSELYSAKKDYMKALEYYKLYSEVKGSIFTKDMGDKIAEMQVKYETEKKEKEIELLQKDNLIYKLKIEKQNLMKWRLYFGLAIVLALVFIVYYHYRLKQKANQLLEKLVAERTQDLQAEITERKQAEETLRKSEAKYRILVETIEEGIGNVDEKENLTFVNQAAANIFGYSKKELLGKNLRELATPEEFQRVLYQTSIRKSGKSGRYELSIIKKNGEYRVITVTATPIFGDNGKYRGVFGIFHDITERKLAEETLRESEEKYRLVTDNITDIVSMCGKNAAFEYISPSCQAILGYDPKSLIGLPVYALVHPDDLPYIKAEIQEKAEKLEDSSAIFRMRHKDGYYLWFESHGRILFDSENKPIGAVFNTRDITRRREMENQLLRSERMAGVGELAAGIAHEIRNPLGNISASAQFCLSKYKLNEEIKQYLEIIVRNSENAGKIIKELLDFANPREISLKVENICEVVDSVIKLTNTKCVVSRVQIIKRCSRKLPQILLDKKRLEEAFLNCIINAVEAMPNGGDLTVTAHPDPKSNEIVVTFLDTGNGISEENLKKIFDPFFTTKEDGVGLGLCLVHQIITAHKGKVHIESKVGRGTKLVVRLPISREGRKQVRKGESQI